MYDRRLDGEVLSFGHAGILYKQSFVMYDRKTESLWVHVTGMAEHGPMKGKQLTFMPSTVTSWGKWKKDYPDTLVLPGYRRGGFMGTYEGMEGYNDDLGLLVLVQFKPKLYPFEKLHKRGVVNDHFNGKDLLVLYSEKDNTATAWRRDVDGQPLTFQMASEKDPYGSQLIRDDQTGSLWSWLTGEAVQGKLKGKLLQQLSYNPILNNRFRGFYPDAPVFQ